MDGELPDQKIPRSEQHGARLLSLGLNSDKAHRRSTCRLSDRFRVSRIILLALDERFDIRRRDQSNCVPQAGDLACPVMGPATGFQGYQTRRLGDGTTHEVLKNFPTAGQMEKRLGRYGSEVRFTNYQYYWLATCRIMAA